MKLPAATWLLLRPPMPVRFCASLPDEERHRSPQVWDWAWGSYLHLVYAQLSQNAGNVEVVTPKLIEAP
jgi:hypothetical protein